MALVELIQTALSSYQFWALTICAYLLYKKLTSKRYHLPPRPHSWPIIGNVYHVTRGNPILYRWCKNVAREVGPIFRISLGPFDAVVLNDIESVRRAMQAPGDDLQGRMKSYLIEVVSENYNDITSADADDPTFKARRKLLATATKNFSIGRPYENRVRESLKTVFKHLDEFAQKNEAFDPSTYSKLFVYNVMASICFQKGYDINDPEFIGLTDLLQELNEAFSGFLTLSDTIPLARYLPFDLWDMKLAKKFRDKLKNLINKEIDESRKRGQESDKIEDLIMYVLKTREEGQKDGLDKVTDLQINQLLGNVFGAGVDTTQMTLRWIFLILAMHQDVQEKIFQEIENNVDDRDDIMVSLMDNKAKMPYSEAVLLETTRIGTVATLGLPHVALRDTKLDEYDIPKGTMVMINHWAIHYDETEFEEPEKFIPERFLDEDGKIGPRPKAYIPFGLGRRSCPGEATARTTIWMIYVSIVKRYKILPEEGTPLKLEYKDSAFEGTPKPYKIILQKRT